MPANWQVWLGGYLALGAALLLLMRLTVIGVRRMLLKSEWLDVISDGERGPTEHWRLLRSRQRTVAMLSLIWLVWPLSVLVGIKELIFPGKRDDMSNEERYKSDPQDAFAYKKRTKARQISPAQAEVLGQVAPDPLGRMPDAPFGHLNAGWQALLGGMTPGDTLHYFEIAGKLTTRDDKPQWAQPRGAKRGLAVLRGKLVQAELVFEADWPLQRW